MTLILIVDDSPTELHQMQKALEKHGYQTAVASDGVEALSHESRRTPGLIFLDIGVHGMDGVRATTQLNSAHEPRTIPVIVVSSKGEETDRIWAMRQGAVDYLVKPWSPEQLVEKARAVLAG